MWTFLIVIHMLICILLMLVVLMQTGKGGLDSTFTGVASGTFGTQGASAVIKKATWTLFAVFAVSCVLLATVNPGQTKKSSSIVDKLKKEAKANPGTPAQQPVLPK